MVAAKLKKNRENIEVNVFPKIERAAEKSIYTNLITKDPNVISQILIDLMVLGFPIEKAIKLFNSRVRRRDWMGV